MPRALLAAWVILVALLPSSAWAGRRALRYDMPIDRVDHYEFQTTHDVHSRWVSGPPGPEIPPFQTVATGRLERHVARAFRDGSFGVLERLVGPRLTVSDPTAREIPVDVLEGRSVVFRGDDGGSVFDSLGWSTFGGAGGGFDAFMDVFLAPFQHLPVRIPDAKKGMPALFRVRVPIDAFAEIAQTWTLRYRLGPAPDDCPRCLSLIYNGQILEDSPDRHPDRATVRRGDAAVAGSLVFTAGRRKLVRHAWRQEWRRTVSPPADRTGATLEQQDVFEGSLVWVAAP